MAQRLLCKVERIGPHIPASKEGRLLMMLRGQVATFYPVVFYPPHTLPGFGYNFEHC